MLKVLKKENVDVRVQIFDLKTMKSKTFSLFNDGKHSLDAIADILKEAIENKYNQKTIDDLDLS